MHHPIEITLEQRKIKANIRKTCLKTMARVKSAEFTAQGRFATPRRHLLRTMLLAFFILALPSVQAEEATWEYSVQISATVQSSPPQILLTWPQDTVLAPSSYTVYRKSLNDTDWGQGTILDGSTTSFLDTAVADGAAYEYQIVKVTSAYTGYGYIYAGIDAPLTEARGTVVLVVDNTYADALGTRLARLQQDLAGDGWTVLRHDVSPNDPVTYIKSLIQNDYYADPSHVNTVFLFGHVPVPYSGDIVPDEHVPNHQGAWPADVYYADMYGTWTDDSVNDTGADNSRNWNVPGDGKFDQSYPPVPVQLMVGRVDLSNLPGKTSWDGPANLPDEQTLLANYLDKDHNFRQKVFDLPRRGVIGNYFGDFYGEAFAASGWRNFAPFFGHDNITDLPDKGTWLPTLNSQAFLWAYGCGPGGPDSVGGLGGNDNNYYTAITPDFYNADIQSVFVMLFGSWFGDWDQQDDLMRGVLATPSYSLACMWSGSPQWFCQHMALGQTLGFSTRLTQNNGTNGLYQTEVEPFAGMVHVALMGDPTLRMHVVGPPANLVATPNGDGVQLSWDASYDNVVGYNVYRSDNSDGPFTRINDQLLIGNTFTDSNPNGGSQTYMVRAIKLENTPSGTYYNASQGISSTLSVDGSAQPIVTVSATVPNASRIGSTPGVFTLARSGDTSADLTVYYSLSGTATAGYDYTLSPDSDYAFTVPSGSHTATLTIVPQPSQSWVGPETVTLTLQPSSDSEYSIGTQNTASINIHGNNVNGISLTVSNAVATLAWPAASGRTYHVAYEQNLDQSWTDFGWDIPGTDGTVFWSDPSPATDTQRFYRVFETQ